MLRCAATSQRPNASPFGTQPDLLSDHFIAIQGISEAQPITVVCVYAPTVAGDRERFFQSLLAMPRPAGAVAVGGDFNCVLEPELDRSRFTTRDQMSESLSALIAAWNLVDAVSDDILGAQTRSDVTAFQQRYHSYLLCDYRYRTRVGAPRSLLITEEAVRRSTQPRKRPPQLRYPLPAVMEEAVLACGRAIITSTQPQLLRSTGPDSAALWDEMKTRIRRESLVARRTAVSAASARTRMKARRLHKALNAIKTTTSPVTPQDATVDGVTRRLAALSLDPIRRYRSLRAHLIACQTAASARTRLRCLARHAAQDEEGDYEMGDDGDFEGDDLEDADLCVAIPATQASASLPPAAPPRPAPLIIDVDADNAADAQLARAGRADHADAADSEAHSARGMKRRAASLVAEDAMSAQRLARQLRFEGLGAPASAKRNRSSPGSGPSPTITSITTGSQATSPAGSTPSSGAPPSRRELVAAAALARSQGDNAGGNDAGGAGPSAPGDAPLTFTGSDAASHVASYTAVPAAPPGVALAPPVFPRVPLPFALGNVRGRSSVSRYNSLDETQRPWDAMWRGRVRHVFLFNPNQLSAAQVDWISQVLCFMFRYRRQYWQRQHWFPLSRQSGAPSSITAAYATREASDRELVVAFRALTDSARPGTSTASF
ncbi:hypothetical protein P43SY_011779 [Pythium insidiosum]|uniref:Endonuclease/exonuclease/phosphatase domain-containing protein n=1 Tax=Pythium insidiosum TaxID=114742 RepID=A0AAD5LSD6_PYTIN|nr:hypothetical protein P43SY_011779 [Pythium insidiosum]